MMTGQTRREWIRHNGALCLHGYPIRIVRKSPPSTMNFEVQQEGRAHSGAFTLDGAKYEAVRQADEIDEFEGVPE